MANTLSFLAIVVLRIELHVLAKENYIYRGTNSKLQYAIFKDHSFRSLNVPTIDEAHLLSGRHCLLRCLKNHRCFSTNIAVSPTQDGSILCQLLSSDKYNSSEQFGSSQIFHHYSIVSPCESFPCQHGGSCQALYGRTDDYICNCTDGYTGKNCEYRMLCNVTEGWRAFDSSCYKYFTDPLTWSDAELACKGLNGSLVSLNTHGEDEFVYTHVLPDSYRTWIGLYGIGDAASNWRWTDGSVPTYAKWGPEQPTKNDDTNCVVTLYGKHYRQQWIHEWNDRSCSSAFSFVCETKHEEL